MTDRPLIFSAPMIRALLDGSKTQTRRVLKPWPGAQAKWLTMDVLHQSPSCQLADCDGHLGVQMQHPHAGQRINGVDIDPMSPLTWVRLPYSPGDRAWGREAWAKVGDSDDDIHACPDLRIWAYYRADAVDPERQRWRPSIHMPRWASRITLHITDVRVQRLQDITEADAVAEGCRASVGQNWWQGYRKMSDDPNIPLLHQTHPGDAPPEWMVDPRPAGRSTWEDRAAMDAFRTLWNSLHGADAWAANPWVCALTFTVQRGNIDGGAA